jgi:hypothetical protein
MVAKMAREVRGQKSEIRGVFNAGDRALAIGDLSQDYFFLLKLDWFNQSSFGAGFMCW